MNQIQDTTSVTKTTRLSVEGMSCGACVRHVTRALESMTGVVLVNVDLQKNEATVAHLVDRVDENSLVAAINEAGYHAAVVGSSRGPGDPVSQIAPARQSSGCCCR
jgi:copper chaperone